ncbi:hypothetical protein PMAYCL1PPCAC_09750, partial [Pristionchus mayeri]
FSLLDLFCRIRLVRCSRLHGSRLLLATEELLNSKRFRTGFFFVFLRARLLVTVILLVASGILWRTARLAGPVDGVVANVHLELLGHVI